MIRKIHFVSMAFFSLVFFQITSECLADVSGQLEQAKDNVYALIDSSKFAEAKSAMDSLVADFNSDPNLPEVRHLIAVQYERVSNFKEAKSNFQQIIQKHPDSPFVNKARLGISRAEAMSFVMTEKFDRAKKVVDKMAVDFVGSPDLPEAQYWIAERYERNGEFEGAKSLCERVIRDYPSSFWAEKAKMSVARANAMSLVTSQKFDEAKAAVNKMAVDFAGNPDLPEVQYWIAEKFERNGKFEDVNFILKRLIQDYPNSSWAEKAKLSVLRAEAMACIMTEKYGQAQKTLDKMAVDFAGKPALPGALYWTTERFERLNRFEDATHNYQRIIQNYPDSPYFERAKLGISRAEVMSLIISRRFEQAQIALNKMMSDFAENPYLPETLYWITEKYEWADKFDDAKNIYQQIIQNHPDSPFASKAKLGIRRVDVMALMESADGNPAEEALNKLIVDFKDNPELSRAVLIIGAKCFLNAKVPDYPQRAVKILEKVLYELPRTEAMTDMYTDVYCCTGDCYFVSGEYTKAMSYYEKLVNEFPEYTLSYHAQFRVGEIYEKLGESGQIPVSEAQNRTRLAYEQLLNKYPDCKYADSARIWLSQH